MTVKLTLQVGKVSERLSVEAVVFVLIYPRTVFTGKWHSNEVVSSQVHSHTFFFFFDFSNARKSICGLESLLCVCRWLKKRFDLQTSIPQVNSLLSKPHFDLGTLTMKLWGLRIFAQLSCRRQRVVSENFAFWTEFEWFKVFFPNGWCAFRENTPADLEGAAPKIKPLASPVCRSRKTTSNSL